MAKIIGLKIGGFVPKDGSPKVEGATVYVTEPLIGDKTSGVEAWSIFMSQSKLDALGFTLKVGQEVEIMYNRYGKVYRLDLKKKQVDDDDGDIIDFDTAEN